MSAAFSLGPAGANPHPRPLGFPRGSTSTVFTYTRAANTNANPHPAFLQGRGAHTGRRVVLRLAQRQSEVLPGRTGRPHALPALGLELHYTVFLRDPHLVWAKSALRSRQAGNPVLHEVSCWRRSAFGCYLSLKAYLNPPKSPHTVAGKQQSQTRRSSKQPDQSCCCRAHGLSSVPTARSRAQAPQTQQQSGFPARARAGELLEAGQGAGGLRSGFRPAFRLCLAQAPQSPRPVSSTGRWGGASTPAKVPGLRADQSAVPQTQLVLSVWGGRTRPHAGRSEAQDAAS